MRAYSEVRQLSGVSKVPQSLYGFRDAGSRLFDEGYLGLAPILHKQQANPA